MEKKNKIESALNEIYANKNNGPANYRHSWYL
jgi:hypothetical protein